MKKKIIIILISLIILISIPIIWYNISLSKTSSKSDIVKFNIKMGTNRDVILDNLESSKLIRSTFASKIYLKLHRNILFKAGEYKLDRNMSSREIFKMLSTGGVGNDITITFKEGLRIPDYVEILCNNFKFNKDEVIKRINSKEFLTPLIKEYWFLTDDILNKDIYYALEGYLYPDTYNFYENATLEDIIKIMLKETDKKLSSIKNEIKKSKYSIHEILTMSSIIEKEAITYEDRTKVSQVIYKRLDTKMALGMDVTSYYGARLDLKEIITAVELNQKNPYNTRAAGMIGLPVGPICNPSVESINAALKPSDTNYVYFFADIKTGKVYFTDNYNEFLVFKEKYK